MSNIIEFTRKASIDQLFKMKSFSHNWQNSWKQAISNQIGASPTSRSILDLGDSLGDIFRTTGVSGRGQNQVSAAGATWEALVCWYLNLCLSNSRVVVIKQNKNMIPEPIRNALTVLYGNFPSNTEADLIAITFPDHSDYRASIEELSSNTYFQSIGLSPFNRKGNLKHIDVLNALTARDFNKYEINVIQCKTNWNDNAQIPMLWDMIYRATGFSQQITVGKNGYSIRALARFSYSFITVPTVNRNGITANSTQVKRVLNLSGGNFWGYPTLNNVAQSIKEIINHNYGNGTNHSVLKTLPSVIKKLHGEFAYFKI